jgi:hypothetical protein
LLDALLDPLSRSAHEQRVQQFLASVPRRRRERAERLFPVLEDRELRAALEEESPWAPDLLDSIEASDGVIHRTPVKDEPRYGEPSSNILDLEPLGTDRP